MHSCLHDGMWALHELAWHAGTFVASHNLATAWHRVCNDVMGLGCHAKAILCMGGIHVNDVLPACMPPPIMGAPPPMLAPTILLQACKWARRGAGIL